MAGRNNDELETVIVVPITTTTGAARFVVWNRDTNFQQRCRTMATAMKVMQMYNNKVV